MVSRTTLAVRGVLNVPIIENKGLSAKFFYFHNDSDGVYRHGITGERVGFSNNDNFGASFLVAPEGSNFDALLTVEKQLQQFDPVVANLTNSSELFCGFIAANECNRNTTKDVYTVFGLPALSDYSAPAVTLEMNWDLGPVKLTSVSGKRRSKENQTQDFDASSTDLYYVRRRQEYKQVSQELRASGQIGSGFDYVVGGYYFESDYQLIQHTRLFGFNPTVDPLIADTNAQTVNGSTQSYAFFGDFNLKLMDTVRMSFGGRYTSDKKSLRNSFATTGLVGQGSGKFNKFTPKVGLDWRPDGDTMLYASWSRGYRSGGFSPRAATAATASTPYQPETVDSYEIGTKLDLLDRKVTLNLAAFYSKYKSLHQNTTIPGGPTGNQTITSNVGSATIKGVEGDFVVRASSALKFTGSFGYLTSGFKDFIVGGVVGTDIRNFDYSGNDMIYSPKFSGSLGAEYTMPTSFGEMVANVGYRHIGAYDQQISAASLTVPATGNVIVNGNDPRVRTSVADLLDASLTSNFQLGGMDAKLTFWGRNLLNDLGTTHGFTVAGLWSFGTAREPRTYGATLGFKF